MESEELTVAGPVLLLELKLECKKEPIADLVPVLPGYLKTEPQVQGVAESPSPAPPDDYFEAPAPSVPYQAGESSTIFPTNRPENSAVQAWNSILPASNQSPSNVPASFQPVRDVEREAGTMKGTANLSTNFFNHIKTEGHADLLEENGKHQPPRMVDGDGDGTSTANKMKLTTLQSILRKPISFDNSTNSSFTPAVSSASHGETRGQQGNANSSSTAQKAVIEIVLSDSDDESVADAAADNSSDGWSSAHSSANQLPHSDSDTYGPVSGVQKDIPLVLKHCFKDVKYEAGNYNVTAVCKLCSKTLKGSIIAPANFLSHLQRFGHAKLLEEYEKLKPQKTKMKKCVIGSASALKIMKPNSFRPILPKPINFDNSTNSSFTPALSSVSLIVPLTQQDSSQRTRDVGAATSKQCKNANIPATSVDSSPRPEAGGSLADTDAEDTGDAFQGNSTRVCPKQSVQRDVVPVSDAKPTSRQKAKNVPKCLGPFYIATKCPGCGEEIPDRDAADKHTCFYSSLSKAGYRYSTFMPHSGLKCSLCDSVVFYCPGGFKKHVRSHFTKFYFSCSICGKKVGAKKTFVVHSYTHSGRWPYSCGVCGRGCPSEYRLEKHEMVHCDRRSLVCEICGEMFKTERSLSQHQEIHQQKFYPCTVCNKVSKTSKGFKSHLARHKAVEERKKYKCDDAYMTLTGLKYRKEKYHFHKKTEKKYPCTVCDKIMSCQAYLERHLMLHTGEKRYTCDICKNNFSTKQSLARHIGEHSGEHKFTCDVCGMKFTQRSSIKRHKGTAHS